MTVNDCQSYRELLTDLVEGELESADVIRLQGHLGECPDCRSEVVLFRGIMSNLGRIGEEEPPATLSVAVMRKIKAIPFWAVIWHVLKAPFVQGGSRIVVPAMALVALFLVSRPYLPFEIRIENGSPVPSSEVVAIRPIWWGGSIRVNDIVHPASSSGKVTVRPGDLIRTTERVELSLSVAEATIDAKSKASLIVKTDGIFLASGRIRVQIDGEVRNKGLEIFKITTPNATVTHLGTIFSVQCREQTTRVDVYVGRVRILSNNGACREVGAGTYGAIDSYGILQSGPSLSTPISMRPPRIDAEDVREICPSQQATTTTTR